MPRNSEVGWTRELAYRIDEILRDNPQFTPQQRVVVRDGRQWWRNECGPRCEPCWSEYTQGLLTLSPLGESAAIVRRPPQRATFNINRPTGRFPTRDEAINIINQDWAREYLGQSKPRRGSWTDFLKLWGAVAEVHEARAFMRPVDESKYVSTLALAKDFNKKLGQPSKYDFDVGTPFQLEPTRWRVSGIDYPRGIINMAVA